MLLNYGTNVNCQGGEYGCALPAASARGHEVAVKLLLVAGADLMPSDESFTFFWDSMKEECFIFARKLCEPNTSNGHTASISWEHAFVLRGRDLSSSPQSFS